MPRHHRIRPAFTLTELLVVILIIGILIAILIPTVRSVRESSMRADTRNLMAQLINAITRYHQDFNAYPGIFSNAEILNQARRVPEGGGNLGSGDPITMTENMVLSLLGGIRVDGSNWVYEPSLTTSAAGAYSLGGAPKRYSAYLSVREGLLSRGKMADSGIIGMSDSAIPEFLDTWPLEEQLPIIYVRARRGANGIVSDTSTAPNVYQYDRRFFTPYLRDTDKLQDLPSAVSYLRHPSLGGSDNATGTPVGKDQFLLIAAGVDRIYGTEDDITSWGN